MDTEQGQPLKREFTGIWISADIWENAGLTLLEKVFMAEIESLGGGKKGCYASNEYFATFFGVGVQHVSNTIASLVKKGFVRSEIDQKRRQKRLLFLTDLYNKSYTGSRPKVIEAVEQKLYHITEKITKREEGGAAEPPCPPAPKQSPRSQKTKLVHVAEDPPTEEQVRAWLEKHGKPLGEAAIFLAHYGANGWMQAGGKKVYSWTHALTGWLLRERKFEAERNPQISPSAPPPRSVKVDPAELFAQTFAGAGGRRQ